MPVDKVRPLKFETSIDGTEVDYLPTEANPSEDYIASKGLAFEGLDTHRIEKIGRIITGIEPNGSTKPTFLANGELDYVELFTGATQTAADRLAKISLTYDGSLNPTTETWLIYDTNGTTVLRTITFTHTFVSTELTNSSVAFT